MICCYEMRKGRGSCVEPSSLKNFGSMFDAEAIHAQIPSNIEPNYQRTWCNGHKTGHASFLSGDSRYAPLALWLQQQPSREEKVTLTFMQIQEILREELPASARQYRSWWANDSVG